MNKKALTFFLIFCVFASLFIVLIPSVNAEAPWFSGWSRRELFYWQGGTPLNSSASVQGNLTVINQTGFNSGVTFYIYNETLPSFEDLRVTLSDGTTVLPIWNQTTNYGLNCTFWVLFPSVNASYWLYWNNPSASAIWSESAVFVNVKGNVAGAWNMEDASGSTIKDWSGNGNTGTSTGTTVISSNIPGKNARYFNGSGDHIVISNSSSLGYSNPQITFGGIFYVNALPVGVNAEFMSRANNGFKLEIVPDGSFVGEVYINSGTEFSTSKAGVFAAGNWYFIALTFDGNTLKLYANSTSPIQTKTGAGATTFYSYANPWSIGSSSASSKYANVNCSFSFISSSVWSDSDMSAIYNGGKYLYPDVTLHAGFVDVRNYVWPAPSLTNFGNVESAFVPTPTPYVGLSGEDASGLVFSFGLLVAGACIAVMIIFSKRSS